MSTRTALALTFLVAAGACRSPSTASSGFEELQFLQDMVLVRPLSVDEDWLLWGRFEATQEEVFGVTERDRRDLPATMISAEQAQSWCANYSLRLPTEREWRQMPLEGGSIEFDSVAPQDHNGLELGLGGPLPVGVFERGRTAMGLYDIFGNVREIVLTENGGVLAYGGSYASRDANRDPREQLELERNDRAEDVGFRYVADATVFFREYLAPRWLQLSREERNQVQAWWQNWRTEYRSALAKRLREDGLDESLIRAVESLVVDSSE